jgi:hypothetical protein
MVSSVVLYWLTSYILGRIESSSRLTIFKCPLASPDEVKYIPQSLPERWIIRPTKLATIQYSVIFPALSVHRFHQNRLDPFLILPAVVSFQMRHNGYLFPGKTFYCRQYFYKHTRIHKW